MITTRSEFQIPSPEIPIFCKDTSSLTRIQHSAHLELQRIVVELIICTILSKKAQILLLIMTSVSCEVCPQHLTRPHHREEKPRYRKCWYLVSLTPSCNSWSCQGGGSYSCCCRPHRLHEPSNKILTVRRGASSLCLFFSVVQIKSK
jgi:hypothetical protein